MQKQNGKLRKILSILLSCTLLFGVLPMATLADDENTETESGIMTLADTAETTTTTLHKVTATEEFVVDSHYVIVYHDTESGKYYALTSDEGDSLAYAMEVAPSGDQLEVTDANCLLQLTERASISDVQVQGKLQIDKERRLKMGKSSSDETPMFDSTNSSITIIWDETSSVWKINASNRYLQFDEKGFSAKYLNSGSRPAQNTPIENYKNMKFEIWTDAETTDAPGGAIPEIPDNYSFVKIATLDQVADLLENGTLFTVVLVQGDTRYAMGAGSVVNAINGETGEPAWLTKVDHSTNGDGMETIDNVPSTAIFYGEGSFLFDDFNEIKYWSFGGGIRQFYSNKLYYYPQNLANGKVPFRGYASGNNNSVQFSYGTGANSDKIYLRGNASDSYLGIGADGNYVGNLSQGDANLVEIEIYLALDTDANSTLVQFIDSDGKTVWKSTYATGSTISLPVQGPELEGYSFVGWSTKGSQRLSLDESCNIYKFDDETREFYVIKDLETKYGLIGKCNSDTQADKLDISGMTGTVTLYPIYAVSSRNTAITADEGGKAVVGISDWKLEQNEDGSVPEIEDILNKEPWLGSINVQVYKDGEEWVNDIMYFSYHNDDAADVLIKFVWDDLLKKYDNDVYMYMNKSSEFPAYDQIGHFTIDGVIARQGGSEEGLYYNRNWIAKNGGLLDNVEGGSTLKIYVTTKYNVKYYLNDELLEGDAWTDTARYNTLGTLNAFTAGEKEASSQGADNLIQVRLDNEYKALMDVSITEGEDGSAQFYTASKDNDNEERGISRTFSYLNAPYNNKIEIKDSPKSLVEKGYKLKNDAWILKNKAGEETATIGFGSEYEIIGTSYTTGNTASAYAEKEGNDAFEADVPYTYHLYAYTVKESPQTGDNNNPMFWALLLMASLGAFAGTILVVRKRKSKLF